MSTRQFGDTDNRYKIILCDTMQYLERQYGDLADYIYALMGAHRPVRADRCICNLIEASKFEDQLCSYVVHRLHGIGVCLILKPIVFKSF